MVTQKNGDSISGGRGVPTTCRYDPFRASLLEALRQRWGGRYRLNASLVVMDALDRLLVVEGLLPPDAPLYSSVRAGDPVAIGETMGRKL